MEAGNEVEVRREQGLLVMMVLVGGWCRRRDGVEEKEEEEEEEEEEGEGEGGVQEV